MGKTKHSFSDSEKLIELVRAHPAIYDCTLRSHRDSVYLQNAWKAIAAKMGLEEEKVWCINVWFL